MGLMHFRSVLAWQLLVWPAERCLLDEDKLLGVQQRVDEIFRVGQARPFPGVFLRGRGLAGEQRQVNGH